MPSDTGAPQTRIDSGPSGAAESADAEFSFSSDEARSSFECRLDGGTFEPCRSPTGYAALPNGQHTFEARAIDSFGNVDLTPASWSWTVGSAASTGSPEASTGSAPPLMPLADVTPPTVQLGGRKRQRARRTIGVIVRTTTDDVWAAASGRVRIVGSTKAYALKGVRERFIARGGARMLKLRLSKKALRMVRRALRHRRTVKARLIIDVRDVAGNVAVTKRTVALTL